jgi:hypothetical protein
MISNTLVLPQVAPAPIKAKRETLLDNLRLFSKQPDELSEEETALLNKVP